MQDISRSNNAFCRKYCSTVEGTEIEWTELVRTGVGHKAKVQYTERKNARRVDKTGWRVEQSYSKI